MGSTVGDPLKSHQLYLHLRVVPAMMIAEHPWLTYASVTIVQHAKALHVLCGGCSADLQYSTIRIPAVTIEQVILIAQHRHNQSNN